MRNCPENTKFTDEGYGGGAPGPQWSRYSPAACGEDHARADVHTTADGGLHAGAGGYFLKDCTPWRRSTLEQGKRRKERQRAAVMD